MVYTIDNFAQADLKAVLEQLNLDEKVSLLAGADWWNTVPIPRIGVPSIRCSDGPNGVRGSSHFMPTPANCIPCATALGSTFDTDLIHQVGGLLARDTKAKCSSMLLAPTCNIQRNPLNGRAFESFSEDPFLSGMLAAAYINGLQESGVGAVIKHFVCNDMEHERFSVSIEVAERVKREIYLTPFMIAQKLAKPWSYMTSYSRTAGLHCSEDPKLLQTLLREEWGFDGLIMSDWFGCYSSEEALKAGLDLEMPGPTRFRKELVKVLIGSGKLSEDVIDARAHAVLQVIQRSIVADKQTVENANAKVAEAGRDTPQDRALNRKVATDAIVLLKNSAGILPLDPRKIKTIAVIGPNAKTRTVSGGGSAYLTASYIVPPLKGIQDALEGTGVQVKYTAGCYAHRELPMLDGWMTAENDAPGWTARFSNTEFEKDDQDLLATLVLPSSRVRINDTRPTGLNDLFYMRLSGYIVAEETGVFEFGMSLVGRARLFVDGQLVIDNGYEKQQTYGGTFYGAGTIEEKGVCNVTAGEKYHIEIEFTNYKNPGKTAEVAIKRGQPSLMTAALRLGGTMKIQDEERALQDAVDLVRSCDAAICFTGSDLGWEGEGADRTQFLLPGRTNELVERLLAVKPETIICNQTGSAFAMPWISEATTLLQSWFGGNETGNAIADVVFGEVNPSGRMPLSFPYQIEDCTGFLNWQAENGKVYYGEGLFVGYRGYEATKRDTMFAFGEGQSYTSFDWSNAKANINAADRAEDIAASVKLTVKNTGQVAGSDVVQLYVHDRESLLRRPYKELKGFKKVYLEPGESQEVEIKLDKLAFSYYDDGQNCWVAEAGAFDLILARSCRKRDVVDTLDVELGTTIRWTGV